MRSKLASSGGRISSRVPKYRHIFQYNSFEKRDNLCYPPHYVYDLGLYYVNKLDNKNLMGGLTPLTTSGKVKNKTGQAKRHKWGSTVLSFKLDIRNMFQYTARNPLSFVAPGFFSVIFAFVFRKVRDQTRKRWGWRGEEEGGRERKRGERTMCLSSFPWPLSHRFLVWLCFSFCAVVSLTLRNGNEKTIIQILIDDPTSGSLQVKQIWEWRMIIAVNFPI